MEALKLNIYTNIAYGWLVHAFEVKKMGSTKDHFREYLRENENIYENILGYCSRRIGTIDLWEKPEFKNLMLHFLALFLKAMPRYLFHAQNRFRCFWK